MVVTDRIADRVRHRGSQVIVAVIDCGASDLKAGSVRLRADAYRSIASVGVITEVAVDIRRALCGSDVMVIVIIVGIYRAVMKRRFGEII